MPFKLRLRKTRHYNVLSRNVLVLSVELIDKTTLECTLSSDSTGLECLHNVCQRLGLQQPEFFGLRYMSKRPYPKVRWVELDRPLKKQLDKYAQSPALSLAVQYYIHDVGLLQDDVTRSHYFLQVKQDVLEGRLRSNYEQAVLLASYSLQAEFGDHQPERHTPDYLKDFRLFPKQAVSEGEMASLLEAVVWQYSSLAGLAQALAETYYILEAQRLPGYGQETFIARDEKGCEVYLGASLLGIVVQPASGEIQTFYRWNDITNLINHKRNFGIECSRSDETVQFTFEEPDAAKYVWKMCVKQHTFYKGNQELLEGVGGIMETRSLAIPDLQSSVMASGKISQHSNPNREMVKMDGRICDISLREDHCNSRAFTGSLPHLDLSFTPKQSTEKTILSSPMESSTALGNHESFGLMSQSLFSLNTSRFSIKQPHQMHESPYGHQEQIQQTKHGDIKPLDSSNHHVAIYSSGRNSSSSRNSARRNLLPQYRPTPDYETALIQKYGPNVNSQVQSLLYSSQPEISHHVSDHKLSESRELDGGVQKYKQYNAYTEYNADHTTPPHQRLLPVPQMNTLHNTYSSPELAKINSLEEAEEKRRIEASHLDYHFIHGYKPPPPYPYSKPSSNSTPDLASNFKCEEKAADTSWRKRQSLLTASLGCLGSPELSRTYENLTDLNDAVESLRKELTKGGETSFLHSFAPNYSTDGLDAIYQLSNGHVAMGQNLNMKVGPIDPPSATLHVTSGCDPSLEEPIYQNVEVLLSEKRDDGRERAMSVPEIDGGINPLKTPARTDHLSRLMSVAASIEDTHSPVSAKSWHTKSPQYVNDKQVPLETVLNVQQSNLVSKSVVSPSRLPHNMMPKKESHSVNVSSQVNATQEKDSASLGSLNACAKKEIKKPDLLSETPTKDPKTAELESKMASLDIVQEYESVPRSKPNPDFTSASRPENIPRNRYKDILPYEENRVKITPSKDNKAGYINASHITASIGDTQKFFICAQGPLTSTVGHFWQCIWETDVRLIVMLASVVGDTQTSKSFPYWPQSDNSSVECDQFRIYRKHSTASGSHVTCRLQLVHIGQRKSRAVWHLQFTDWADHGCPQDTQAFINFLQELSTLRRVTYSEVEGVGRNRNTPVLVHCSAGVGRSGVTIMCDLLLETADHNIPIDPPKVLRHLRQQRVSIVQSFNQYKFVYKVILTYLQKARLI